MKDKWNIRSRAHRCASSGRHFEQGELVFSILRMAADEDSLERSDFCEVAWHQTSIDPTLRLSQWTSRYQPPEPQRSQSEPTKESPGDLLRRLVEEDHPSTENARFVLALLLERRRQLRETARTQDREGVRVLHYELKVTGELFLIKDPELRLDDLTEVQREVSALLASPPSHHHRPVGRTRLKQIPSIRYSRLRLRRRRTAVSLLRRR